MIAVAHASIFDARKILSNRIFWIVALVILISQPLFALIEANQIAGIGVTATPQTNPELIEPLPPVAFMGFDVTPFGEVVIIVLGALLGTTEYCDRELRTTFLAIGRRSLALIGKIVAMVGLMFLLSTVANYLTLAFTHVGLGTQGINPLILTIDTWSLLGRVVLIWIAFGLISWAIAVITKHWLVAMLLMIPQAVGLGDILASSWPPARYLPVPSGHCLTAVPTGICTWQPSALSVLTITTVVLLVVAGLVFIRRDVGNR